MSNQDQPQEPKADQERPSEEATDASNKAQAFLAFLLSMAQASAHEQGRQRGNAEGVAEAMRNMPITFAEAAARLAGLELERRAVLAEIASLGFDPSKVERAALLHVELSSFDDAILNPQ